MKQPDVDLAKFEEKMEAGAREKIYGSIAASIAAAASPPAAPRRSARISLARGTQQDRAFRLDRATAQR